MVKTYLRSIYTSFATHVLDIPSRLLALLSFLLLLFLPLTLAYGKGQQGHIILGVLISANLFAIYAASWDLLVGRSGQISLGHGIFFGIGAYATALSYAFFKLPPWVTILLAMLTAVLAALILGYPCIRVRGPYLALVTMAFPLIAASLVQVFKHVTRGGDTMHAPRLFPFLDFISGQRTIAEFYLTTVLLLVSSIIMYKVANSKIGIVLVSILDDELGSKACGIDVTKYKLLAFSVSALFASLAGSVYAHTAVSGAEHSVFYLTLSFLPVIFTILGGIGTIYGPIVAAYTLTFLDQYVLSVPIRVHAYWHPIIFIIPVILFVIKWPRGIARFVTDKLEDLSEERELEERGPHIWKKYKKEK